MNQDQSRIFYLIFGVRWSKQWGPLLPPDFDRSSFLLASCSYATTAFFSLMIGFIDFLFGCDVQEVKNVSGSPSVARAVTKGHPP